MKTHDTEKGATGPKHILFVLKIDVTGPKHILFVLKKVLEDRNTYCLY